MTELYREWIASGLLKKGKSKGGLAGKLGIHQSQVTRLLGGNRQVKVEEIPLIAEYLEEPRPDIEVPFEAEAPDDRPPPRTIPIIGYVGAGGQAREYAVPAGQLEEIEAPDGSTPDTVAVEIRGESLGKMFDRWLVYYDRVERPVTDDLVGEVCVVGLVDGRILIKRLQRSKNKGLFHLISETEDAILDAAVEWAAPVKSMAPRSTSKR